MDIYHFLVLGEEQRQSYLASILRKEGQDVRQADEYVPGYHDAILLPVPDTARYFKRVFERLQKGQVVFGCHFLPEQKQLAKEKGIRLIDYMEQEGVASRNAVATAEGAIVEAVMAGCKTLQNAKVLVLGYGTCGCVLADKLAAWKACVTVADRKEGKRQRILTSGYQAFSLDALENEMGKFDFIFNTIPALVLQEQQLQYVKKEVVIVDIASRPGGVDFDYCRKKGINAKLCLGLPGKYAPKSSAGILMEVIRKIISGD